MNKVHQRRKAHSKVMRNWFGEKTRTIKRLGQELAVMIANSSWMIG